MRTQLRSSWTRFFGAVIAMGAVSALGAPTVVGAQQFRTIASLSAENYFDGSFALHAENVLIMPLPPESLQFQFKARNQTDNFFDSTRSLTMVHAGPIILFTPNVYGIAAYGIGLRDTGELVHEGDLQIHYEDVRFRVGGGARGRYEPDDDIAYIIPSIGGRLQLPRGFGIAATYYLGLNNKGELSNAIWTEGDYSLTSRVSLKLGGSMEIGDDIAWPDGSNYSYAVISGVGYAARETLFLRYELHYIGRAELDDGIRNFLFVDWRF